MGYDEVHTFVDEHQAQVVSGRVFLVHLTKGGREVEAAEEQSDRYRLSWLLLANSR
jgi:hypothetical protein